MKTIKTQVPHVIVAQGFKQIGRTTRVEKQLALINSLSTGQLYASGLVKDLKDMFSDGMITPPEKSQLALVKDRIDRDFSITKQQASDLNIPFNTAQTKYDDLMDYLDEILADMSSTYVIDPDDPSIAELIEAYDTAMNALSELVSASNAEQGFYGALDIRIILSAISLEYGQQSNITAEVSYKGTVLNLPAVKHFNWKLTGITFEDDRYDDKYNPSTGMYEDLQSWYVTYDELTGDASIEVSTVFNSTVLPS